MRGGNKREQTSSELSQNIASAVNQFRSINNIKGRTARTIDSKQNNKRRIAGIRKNQHLMSRSIGLDKKRKGEEVGEGYTGDEQGRD